MDVEKACRRIAKELGEDYNTVYNIVMHQYDVIQNVMKDKDNYRDILIHDLFRFKLKSRYKKDKSQEYKAR